MTYGLKLLWNCKLDYWDEWALKLFGVLYLTCEDLDISYWIFLFFLSIMLVESKLDEYNDDLLLNWRGREVLIFYKS